ncbi:MAG: hypothetical protein JSV42_13995 [Chloroflexota bacterium]|nr:MAG: hypothetical protein JSV42_13995 [Chloroflexota bacterium]
MPRAKKVFSIAAIALLAVSFLLIPTLAFAQTYTYSLPQQFIDVYWNEDGTSSLDYVFIFTNNPSGATIEYVDVGVPNSNYDLNSVVAYANGVELNDIEPSPYVQPGVAVGLGSQSIPGGQTGEVRVFIGRVRDVLFPDDLDENYVSAVFIPNYFEGGSISGSTETVLSYHFPPGMQPEEPRWHEAPSGFSSEPEGGIDDQGRLTYTWRNPSADATRRYTFGASFPKQYIQESAVVTGPPPPTSGAAGTSFIAELFGCITPLLVPIICIGGFLGLVVWGITSDRSRKLKYLPPKISIEGHGIKRGLTAVEAGILMEEPMDKIMTMILFGLLKKDAATVISRDPLDIEPEKTLPENLRKYELDFLEAFQEKSKGARKKALQKMMVELVRSVGQKMKGFSLKESVAYYKDITRRAWEQVEAADTPEVKSEKFDQHMEWTMLDRDYDDRTRDVFRTGPVFVPIWWPRYDPGFGRAATGSAAPSTPSLGRSGPSMPTLPGSAFAGSVITGVQSFSSSVVGSISDFTSSITNVTNPPPKPPASSFSRSGGGGGGGCACACACAGCACACAGGGR